MRFAVPILFCLMSLPALAQVWTHYANARFAYSLDIPPLYEGQGESANGDGQIFYLPNGRHELLAWGGLLGVTASDLAGEATQRLSQDMAAGWAITYQAGTPQWAVWSGTRGDLILYQRMIMLCDGTSYAAFRLTHPTRDMARNQPIVEGLVRSLRAEGC